MVVVTAGAPDPACRSVKSAAGSGDEVSPAVFDSGAGTSAHSTGKTVEVVVDNDASPAGWVVAVGSLVVLVTCTELVDGSFPVVEVTEFSSAHSCTGCVVVVAAALVVDVSGGRVDTVSPTTVDGTELAITVVVATEVGTSEIGGTVGGAEIGGSELVTAVAGTTVEDGAELGATELWTSEAATVVEGTVLADSVATAVVLEGAASFGDG